MSSPWGGIIYARYHDPASDSYWVEATRIGQFAPVGYGDDQREALEALLRAEHREATE